MRAFDILHDDAHLVVVDKAAGVLTVPTAKREKNTLVAQLEKHLRVRLVIVHRLDRDTSGALVFAKSERVGRALMDRWDSHERVYAAIVAGVMRAEQGTLRSRLLTEKNLDRRSARPDEQGEDAVTHFSVRQRLEGATLLDVTLETGRRNQIRVHLAEAGHPILGDVRYARNARPHPRWRGGLALHARRLSFVHPVVGTPLTVDSPLPEAMLRFTRGARPGASTRV